MSLRVLKTSMDGLTGLIQCEVRVEEKSPSGGITGGPRETISIFPQALLNLHSTLHGASVPATPDTLHSTLIEWLRRYHATALVRKHQRNAAASVTRALDGEVLDF